MSKRVPPQCDHERVCVELASLAQYDPSRIGSTQITLDYRKLFIPSSSLECYISTCTPDSLYLIISFLDIREVLYILPRVCKGFLTIIRDMFPEIILKWWKDAMTAVNSKNSSAGFAQVAPILKLGLLKGDEVIENLERLRKENPQVIADDPHFKQQVLGYLLSAGAQGKSNPHHISKGNAVFHTFKDLPFKELLSPVLLSNRCPYIGNLLYLLHEHCRATYHMQIRDMRVSSSWGGYPPRLAAKMSYFLWDMRQLVKGSKGYLVVYVNENYSVHM